MKTLEASLDGYTDLPPGHIANVVTYLQMRQPQEHRRPLPDGVDFRRVPRPDLATFRRLYARIGEDWLWFSRSIMPNAELAAALERPTREVYFLERKNEAIGLVELDRSGPEGDVEISLFGLVPEATGQGLALPLMGAALEWAWRPPARRVWLHTCSFDHPAAIHFYMKAGFEPFKFAIEISPDPRLSGHLPESAAPHVALIRP